MKTDKTRNFLKLFLTTLGFLALGFLMIRCDDDDPQVVEPDLYMVSGNISYPNADGISTPATGAVVYLAQSATPTTNYSWSAVAGTNGSYSIGNLPAGDYFMFVNYNTNNKNLPGGRIDGVNFDSGEGVLFSITDADVDQFVTLESAGQEASAINTTDNGDWNSDFSHSNIDFAFAYDEENATYTGRFDDFFIEIDFDPADLSGSSLSASIDLLSVNTSSPGGRDSYFDTNLNDWDYGCLRGTFGVVVDQVTNLPDEATRYATFDATGFEVYGDGFIANGNFTFNGVTSSESLFFRFIDGYEGQDFQGNQLKFSSFEGQLHFDALDTYGVSSSHLGSETVTVDISYQVNKAL